MTKSGVDELRSQIFFLLFTVFIILLAAGCAETPTNVGVNLLPKNDFLQLDTTIVTSTRSYNGSIIPTTSVAPRILVGSVNGLQCWGLYRFAILPDSVKTYPIVSAELDLRTVYHFGDSLAPFSMAVHRILMNWVTDSLTIDSLKAAGFYSTTQSGVWNPSSIGDTSTITIPLDTNMIRSWGTVSDTVYNNYGVLLRPTNNGVVKGFGSFNISDVTLSPKLLLRFRDSAGNIDTLIVSTGSNRFVTTGINTSWPTDPTHLWVMNGGAERGYIEFDVHKIPLHAAIHKATLELTLDARSSQFNYFTADSVYAYFVDTSGTTLTYISGIGTPVQNGTAKVYQFPVGQFVQRWVRGASLQRIAIAGYDEYFALDVFSFYGAQSTQALKPKLTVIYSLLQ
jgi:hypothetical protein